MNFFKTKNNTIVFSNIIKNKQIKKMYLKYSNNDFYSGVAL